MTRGDDEEEEKNKEVEKKLREDARGKDQPTDPDALKKIQEKTRRRSGNGQAGKRGKR